jgi:hypothetical protein
VPSYSKEEAQQQLRKSAAYFGEVLRGFGREFLAARVDGVTIIVATGDKAAVLEHWVVNSGIFGAGAHVDTPEGRVTAVTPMKVWEPGTSTPKPAGEQVVLIPRYHEPGSEWKNKQGHVHLHVLNDAKIGRRMRDSGECLCSKKRGSHERAPREGEREMCAECVRVAQEAGLEWSLE